MSNIEELVPAATSETLGSDLDGTESVKRRQILDGARRVFLSHGFDGASMGEIAKVAGVSKGTLYVYFDSKEKLFEVLTTEEKKSLAEALFSLDADDPDVRSVLTRLGQSYLGFMGQPEHISSIRMVIGASEKFPRLGQMFFEAGPQQGMDRLQAYLDVRSRRVAFPLPTPASPRSTFWTFVSPESCVGCCSASAIVRRETRSTTPSTARSTCSTRRTDR